MSRDARWYGVRKVDEVGYDRLGCKIFAEVEQARRYFSVQEFYEQNEATSGDRKIDYEQTLGYAVREAFWNDGAFVDVVPISEANCFACDGPGAIEMQCCLCLKVRSKGFRRS